MFVLYTCYSNGDDMKKYLLDFYEYLDGKGYSSNTVISYKKDLEQFAVYCKDIKVNAIDYAYIREYLHVLYSYSLSTKSISRHISSLKSFFKFLMFKDIINNNPMTLITNPKIEKKLPNYINYNDLDVILNIPNKDDILGLRNSLILEMLYSCGIRVSELINIKLSDIDFNNMRILINGKGNKQRYVLYGEICAQNINDYLSFSRIHLNKKDSPYLLLNKYGDKITDRAIRMIVNDVVVKSNLKIKVSPHTFRHTFATHLLNEGADLKIVQELLGHENIATTGIYTHVSKEHLKKVYLDAHPRARR